MPYYFQANPGLLIILVRHGHTILNSSKKVRGWKDEILSAEGKQAISQLAEEIRPLNPGYIISSDFLRDTATAFIIADALNISGKETDYDARTWDVGVYSGMEESQALPTLNKFVERAWDTPMGSTESFDDFTARWLGFLDRKMHFASIDTMRPIVVVTHGRNIALTDSHFNHKMATEGLMPFAAGYGLLSINDDQSVGFQIQGESECVCEDV